LGYFGRGTTIFARNSKFVLIQPECLIEEKKKSEHMHRKKIDEVNLKRHKINTNYFNNLVKPLDSSRVKQDYRREDQEQR